MNCLYLPVLSRAVKDYKLADEEIKHIKVLRISQNEIIMVVNGKGLTATGKITLIRKNEIYFRPDEYIENSGENPFKSGLALGILDNRDRLEIALEKAVELGINDFYPLITKYTQTKKINTERLNLKAVSAMKQCCRSVLPNIHSPITINELLEEAKEYERILLADINGMKPEEISNEKTTLLLVGPEGGFSIDEIELMKKDKRVELINLGKRRLRAETSAIVALGLINSR
ncbi:MAG: 16S rRNA (uracil(1498)-N(3))-methyltransferase [Bacteroidetes bacterium]|nr:MAG: 16S rRNA (uracil(1498)-N(3))-methyltransferase [Bacteroidota bacterium]